MKLDDKLYLDRFNTDQQIHIKIADPEVCLKQCQDKPCTRECAPLMFMIGMKRKRGYLSLTRVAWNAALAVLVVPLAIFFGITRVVVLAYHGKMGKYPTRLPDDKTGNKP